MSGELGRARCACLAALFLMPSVAAQTCSHKDDPQFYFQQKYTVGSVAVNSPLSFVWAVRSREKQAEKQLPLQPGHPFTPAEYSNGIDFLREFFTMPDTESPLVVRVVRGELRKCNDSAHTLEIAYYVVLSNPLGYLSRPAESLQALAERPASTQAQSSGIGKLQPSMSLLYDPQWKLTGGAGLAARLSPGVRFSVSAQESSQAHREDVQLAGSGTGTSHWLQTWRYQLAFHREDVPTGSGRIDTARLSLGAGGSTASSGPLHFAARYGLALEGGNDHSTGGPAAALPGTLAAGHGALKGQAGLSFYQGHYAAALSYGIEAASGGASTSVDYLKHLAGLTFVDRFAGRDGAGGVHRYTTFEAEMAGGAMTRYGPIPVAERFFGGEQTPAWTTAGAWTMRGGPLFRGIPGYGLNGAALGGTAFWSFNSTVAKPVTGRPMLPPEVTSDRDVQGQIEAALNTSQQTLANGYELKLPAMQRVVADLAKLTPQLNKLTDTLSGISAPAAAADAIAKAGSKARAVERGIRGGQPRAVLDVDIPPLLDALDALLPLLGASDAAQIQTLRAALAQSQTELQKELAAVDVTSAQLRAQQEMVFPRSALDTLEHEVNLISVAPVWIFDAARLWPDPPGTRFATGAGVRLSIATLNMTAGYAVNLRRATGESRGAVFFSLDVSDLFK